MGCATCIWAQAPMPKDDNLQQLLSTVLFSDKLNPVIQFSGTFTAYDVDSKNDQDILTTAKFTILLDTSSKLKIKMDLTPHISKWENGPVPYYETKESIAFNGKYWVHKMEEAKDETGKTYATNLAIISDKIPDFIGNSHLTTGENFLLARTLISNTGRDYTLRELLSPPVGNSADLTGLGSLPKYTIYSENYKGGLATVFEVKDPCTITKIYCDPTKNFALMKKETQRNLCFNGTPVIDTIEVENSKDIGANFWFPTAVSHTTSVNGKLLAKHKFEIDSASVVTDSSTTAFDLQIPLGWRVQDERYGARFITGKSPADLLKDASKSTQ